MTQVLEEHSFTKGRGIVRGKKAGEFYTPRAVTQFIVDQAP